MDIGVLGFTVFRVSEGFGSRGVHQGSQQGGDGAIAVLPGGPHMDGVRGVI